MNLEKITQRYYTLFPGDFSGNPQQRQTPKVLFSSVQPAVFPNPSLIIFNHNLSEEIGLGILEDSDIHFLVGNELPKNIQPYATAYAGHQFGNWAGQLGDGRAIFAGEISNSKYEITEIQWKGAGATPYSRFADGRAVLRSSVREYLMSEAMHFLNISTTRALSLCYSGEQVIRDIMYSGNPKPEKGAVVIRTAPTFLRFGHFELLSAQNDTENLKKLIDFTIEQYFVEIDQNDQQKYQKFFEEVCHRTAALMVDWYRVGFVHGVMNTDNMSIAGFTIDYGPFSMLDEFDINFTPNTTDLPGRRYAFGKQAQISQWNLWQLANALHPIINDVDFIESTLNQYNQLFWDLHDQMLAKKFGFSELLDSDINFFTASKTMMQDLQLDYTLFFKNLELENCSPEFFLHKVSYLPVTQENTQKIEDYLLEYRKRLQKNTITRNESLEIMKANNPSFVLRNYLLYECIQQIEHGDHKLLNQLIEALQNPYLSVYPELSEKRPSQYHGTPGCSMLSCSS